MSPNKREPLAIVGLAYRFPGSASNDHKLWDLLEKGRTAWGKIPENRFSHDAYYHPDPQRVGSIAAKGGYFLTEEPSAFDAPFFGISPAEAAALDPQQRYLLETTFECIESAGIPMEKIRGSNTGCFAGAFLKDYDIISSADILDVPTYAAIGGSGSFLSNRVSWFYDLKGPSFTLDTACSSSLVAFHLACQSVWTGESDQAFAAGANMILMPNIMRALTQLQFLSPDGICNSFDARANGYARGEGFAVLMIKPVRAAIRDGDCIRAVVRGSASNQNGRTPGITMPSSEAQAALIRTAYEASGLDFDTTGYFEAHGTGTPIGDPLEFSAIAETLVSKDTRTFPLVVGSVKSNIGHLEGTAGLAGLVKAILCVEKGMIPPLAGFETPNPKLNLDDPNLQLATELMEWPTNGIRRASVNSFGAGGSNAHVVIDDAASFLQIHGLKGFHRTITGPSTPFSDSGVGSSESDEEDADRFDTKTAPPRLFVFSAPEQAGVQRISSSYATHLESGISALDENEKSDTTQENASANITPIDLQQLADTLGTRRSDFEWKSFVVASSARDLQATLAKGLPKFPKAGKTAGIAFVFTGQGAQASRMGLELLQYPVYAEHIRQADEFLTSIGASWSVMEELQRDASSSRIDDARFAQPLCTVLQTALVDLLASFGIAPKSVVGHSSGEIAAAYATGALSKEAAWKVAYFRGLWSAAISEKWPDVRGSMLAVGLGEEEAKDYLGKSGTSDVVIACINSPHSTTLSGPAASITNLREKLVADEIFSSTLRVKVAYHSPAMSAIAQDYFDSIKDIKPRTDTKIAMYSSVTGTLVKPSALDAQYWVDNMLNPVKFCAAAQALLTAKSRGRRKAKFDIDTFLEIGPHGSLQEPLKQIADLDEKSQDQLSFIPLLQRGKDATQTTLNAVGKLWTRGYAVALPQVNKPSKSYRSQGPMHDLPPYPWNRSEKNHYWHEGPMVKSRRHPVAARTDILGVLEDDNTHTPQYRNTLRLEESPWLIDHNIQGMVVFPATGFVVMAIEAALRTATEGKVAARIELRDVIVQRPLVFTDPTKAVETRCCLKPHKTGTRLSSAPWTSVTIYSRSIIDNSWNEHSSCLFMVHYQTEASDVEGISELSREATFHQNVYHDVKRQSTFQASGSAIYSKIAACGFHYGPLFQNLGTAFSGDLMAVASITIPDTAKSMPKNFEFPHVVHPITMDNFLHLVIPALRSSGINSTMLPTGMESIVVDLDMPVAPGTELVGYAKVKRQGLRETMSTVVISQGDFEKPLVTIKGLYCQEVAGIMNLQKPSVSQAKHVASELHWKEDIQLLSTTGLGEYLAGTENSQEVESYILEVIDLQAFKEASLKVLELDCSGPDLAFNVINRLSDQGQPLRLESYTLSSTLPKPSWAVDFQKAQGAIVEYHLLDFSDKTQESPIERGSFDSVICYSKTTDVDDLSETAQIAYEMLKTGGRFSMVFTTKATDDQIQSSLVRMGFNAVDITTKRQVNVDSSVTVFVTSSKPENLATPIIGDVLLLEPSLHDSRILALMANLESSLGSIGYHVSRATLEQLPETKEKTIISCLDLGPPILNELTPANFVAWQRLVMENNGLLWLSLGGQIETSKNPISSLATGALRTARAEAPHLRLVHLDLSENLALESSSAAQMVLDVFKTTVVKQQDEHVETELAESRGRIVIPRLLTHHDTNAAIHYHDYDAQAVQKTLGDSSEVLHLTVGSPGMLDTLQFMVSESIPKVLPKGSAKVKVTSTPINFVDVMVAMGMVPSIGIGCECSGIIEETNGDGRFNIGDQVVVLTRNSFANYVVEDESMMQLVPAGLSPADAASCATIYVTAYVALMEVARIQKGESVLIHAGAGGLGQAAIQLCQMVGAEIFVTVGSVAKKELLKKNYGIADDHIFNSRDLTFAKGIMRATDQRGVDVILNSTSGEALRQTWHCIAPFGRFLEVGKRDIIMNTGLDMTPFLRNVTYAGVHIDQMVGPHRLRVSKAMADVFDLLAKGHIGTVHPVTIMTYTQIEEAFRLVQQGKHSGKVVLTASDSDTVSVVPRVLDELVLKPDVTYAIGGGLGGVGRSIVDMMSSYGARHFAFFSRSGDTKQEAKEYLATLHSRGVNAKAFKADLSDEKSLAKAIDEMNSVMPPVGGFINSAMNLQDCLFEKMTHEQWVNSLAPKVDGSWNFHKLLPDNLDFFILLSSIAAIIGNPGQSNYAAANGYQDMLAIYRKSIGQQATSINLSAIFGVGHIEENSKEDQLRMKLFEMIAMDEKEMNVTVASAMKQTTIAGSPMPTQLVTGVNPAVLNVPHLGWTNEPKFSIIKRKGQACSVGDDDSTAKSKFMDDLAACTTFAAVAKTFETAMVAKLAKSMMVSPEDINTQKPLHSFGVDSLVAVEVRNWIFKELKSEVTVFDLMDPQPVSQLVYKIAERSKLIPDEMKAKAKEEEAS